MRNVCYILVVFLVIQTICIFNLSKQNYDRYELKQIGSARADQYIFDKHTGRVWQKYKNPETNEFFFSEINKHDIVKIDFPPGYEEDQSLK